jgi:hypothetical protein
MAKGRRKILIPEAVKVLHFLNSQPAVAAAICQLTCARAVASLP